MDNENDIEKAIDFSKFQLNYRDFDFEDFWETIYPNQNLNCHVLILGATGSGKTTFIANLLENRPQWIPKIVFFNTMNIIEIQKISDVQLYYPKDNIEELKKYIHNPQIQMITYTIPKMEENPVTPTQLQFLWGRLCQICYQSEDIVYEEYMKEKGLTKHEDFRPQCNIVIVNDELMKIMDDDNNFANDIHRWILTDGQNYKIVHIGATQRHQNISKILTTQSTQKIIFPIDSYDIGALRDKIEGIDYVRVLKAFHFYWYDSRTKRIRFFSPVKRKW